MKNPPILGTIADPSGGIPYQVRFHAAPKPGDHIYLNRYKGKGKAKEYVSKALKYEVVRVAHNVDDAGHNWKKPGKHWLIVFVKPMEEEPLENSKGAFLMPGLR